MAMLIVSRRWKMAPLITFGIPMVSPATSHKAGRALAARREPHLKAPVEPRVYSSYSELADGLADGRLDFGWLPPVEGWQLAEHAGVECLLQAVRAGRDHYHGVIFVREDASIEAPAQLAGTSLGFVHRRSASGYLLPAAELSLMGIAVAGPPRFLGSHGAVVQAVAEGRLDAGATFAAFDDPERPESLRDAGWLAAPSDPPVPMRVVLVSDPSPTDVVCAWPGTSRRLRAELVAAFEVLMAHGPGARTLQDLFGTARFASAEGQGADSLRHAQAQLARSRPWR
jgi:phosphate/phosphite/phosphonate ABC transporter binding protein